MRETLAQRVGQMAGRLAGLLRPSFPEEGGPLARGLAFLEAAAAAAAVVPAPDPPGAPAPAAAVAPPQAPAAAPEPLDRLAAALGLAPMEVDLLVLAGLPEEHE